MLTDMLHIKDVLLLKCKENTLCRGSRFLTYHVSSVVECDKSNKNNVFIQFY